MNLSRDKVDRTDKTDEYAHSRKVPSISFFQPSSYLRSVTGEERKRLKYDSKKTRAVKLMI